MPNTTNKTSQKKITEVRARIEENLKGFKNEGLIIDLVKMSELVEDLRLKAIFLTPFDNKLAHKTDELSLEINKIRLEVLKLIINDDKSGFTPAKLQKLHSQIKQAIVIAKNYDKKINSLWSFASSDLAKQLQNIQTYLENKYAMLKGLFNKFIR